MSQNMNNFGIFSSSMGHKNSQFFSSVNKDQKNSKIFSSVKDHKISKIFSSVKGHKISKSKGHKNSEFFSSVKDHKNSKFFASVKALTASAQKESMMFKSNMVKSQTAIYKKKQLKMFRLTNMALAVISLASICFAGKVKVTWGNFGDDLIEPFKESYLKALLTLVDTNADDYDKEIHAGMLPGWMVREHTNRAALRAALLEEVDDQELLNDRVEPDSFDGTPSDKTALYKLLKEVFENVYSEYICKAPQKYGGKTRDQLYDVMPKEELYKLVAIKLYVKSVGGCYQMMNHALRSKHHPSTGGYSVDKKVVDAWKPFKQLLIDALKTFGTKYLGTDDQGRDKLLFRGQPIPLNKLYPDNAPDKNIIHGEFLSTSPEADGKPYGDAEAFFNKEGGESTLITIENAIGYKVPSELNKVEVEVIILPDANFKISKIEPADNKIEKITLRMEPAATAVPIETAVTKSDDIPAALKEDQEEHRRRSESVQAALKEDLNKALGNWTKLRYAVGMMGLYTKVVKAEKCLKRNRSRTEKKKVKRQLSRMLSRRLSVGRTTKLVKDEIKRVIETNVPEHVAMKEALKNLFPDVYNINAVLVKKTLDENEDIRDKLRKWGFEAYVDAITADSEHKYADYDELMLDLETKIDETECEAMAHSMAQVMAKRRRLAEFAARRRRRLQTLRNLKPDSSM